MTIDTVTIAAYFALVLGVGFWYRQRAARDLDAYFLGGRRIHWSMLAMSGAVSNFDITGTMWMVAVLMVLGMQSWWQHWMWGVALPAFSLAYMARWVRRSRVMTAAEWMVTRFGEDRGGRAARYAAAIMSVIFTAAVIGYAFQGIGKFAMVVLPLDGLAASLPAGGAWLATHQQTVLALAIFALTTVYVVLGGLYSVVLTDVIQTIVLSVAAVAICIIAYTEVSPAAIAASTPSGFADLWPSWRIERLAGGDQAAYEMFGLLTIAWIAKGLLMNAGGPGQLYDFQRFLATPSVRDACKMAAAWPLFLMVRWGMVMGIALLALSGMAGPGDPEKAMPAVLQQALPVGLRGLVIAGLLAAFMSTFSSTLNSGAAFVVRDLWQPLVAPRASERQLVRASYVATLGLVFAGIVIGLQADSIGAIWSWIMMALSAGIIVPNVLRWYWWRLNGWGYAAGVATGILATLAMLLVPGTGEATDFLVVSLASLTAALLTSWRTRPTDQQVLRCFFETIHPFGIWGAVRRACRTSRPRAEQAARAAVNTGLAVVGLTALYLGPMYLVGHWHARAAVCGGLVVLVAVILARTWYRYLPDGE